MTLYDRVRLVWPSDFNQQLIHCCVTDALLPGHRGRTPLLIFSFFLFFPTSARLKGRFQTERPKPPAPPPATAVKILKPEGTSGQGQEVDAARTKLKCRA